MYTTLSHSDVILVERLTDTYSQYERVVVMMENILKTINGVKSANYQFNKLFSASACAESTARWRHSCSALPVFKESSLQVILRKLITSAWTVSISKFRIQLCCRASGCQPHSCKEYENTYNSWLLPHTRIQPCSSCEFYKEHVILWLHHSQSQRRHLHITSQISTGLTHQLGLRLWPGKSLFLAWEVVRFTPLTVMRF